MLLKDNWFEIDAAYCEKHKMARYPPHSMHFKMLLKDKLIWDRRRILRKTQNGTLPAPLYACVTQDTFIWRSVFAQHAFSDALQNTAAEQPLRPYTYVHSYLPCITFSWGNVACAS